MAEDGSTLYQTGFKDGYSAGVKQGIAIAEKSETLRLWTGIVSALSGRGANVGVAVKTANDAVDEFRKRWFEKRSTESANGCQPSGQSSEASTAPPPSTPPAGPGSPG